MAQKLYSATLASLGEAVQSAQSVALLPTPAHLAFFSMHAIAMHRLVFCSSATSCFVVVVAAADGLCQTSARLDDVDNDSAGALEKMRIAEQSVLAL